MPFEKYCEINNVKNSCEKCSCIECDGVRECDHIQKNVPCQSCKKPRRCDFNKQFQNHKNPELPWLDWRCRPIITYASNDTKHFHYHLKRRVPAVGDVYFHDLPEDKHKYR